MHEIGETQLPIVKDVGAVAAAECVEACIEWCAECGPNGLYGGDIWEARQRSAAVGRSALSESARERECEDLTTEVKDEIAEEPGAV